jgi:integrase
MAPTLTHSDTIGRLILAFLLDLEQRVVAGDFDRDSFFSYRSSLTCHTGPLADIAIGNLTRPQVRQWYRDLSIRSPGAAKSAHARLRAALSWAVDDGLLSENPASSLRITYSPKPGEPFAPAELIEFVARCEAEIRRRTQRACNEVHREHKTAIAEILLICALTGSRTGVVRRATVETYAPAKRALYIPRSKSGHPLVIPLPPRAVAILERRVAAHRGHLFLGRDSTVPVSGTAVYRGFKRIGGELAVTRHPHDLRHTMGTLAVEAGHDEASIMRLGGWSSRGVFEGYTAQAVSPRARAIAEDIEAMVFGERRAP